MKYKQLSDAEYAEMGKTDTNYPYLPPSLRGVAVELFNQFLGAIRTRIEQRQKALWPRIIGAGFTVADIEAVWPERNLKFVAIKYSGIWQSFNVSDLNLRELDALEEWLSCRFESNQTRNQL